MALKHWLPMPDIVYLQESESDHPRRYVLGRFTQGFNITKHLQSIVPVPHLLVVHTH